jgi:hypothetical protein
MASMKLIYTTDGKSEKSSPSSNWNEIQMTNKRDTSIGNILFLGVKEADKGSPTMLMPKMIAPFGESKDTYNRTTLDLSVSDESIRDSLTSLTKKCRMIIRSSGIEDADTIADSMLPIMIDSTTGEHAPRIRVRMNGGETIKYTQCQECDTIPRGSEVRTIIEVRNIWVSRKDDGSYRCGVGLYLHSARVNTNVKMVEEKKDLTSFLFEDEE